jgi:hypothetical protein
MYTYPVLPGRRSVYCPIALKVSREYPLSRKSLSNSANVTGIWVGEGISVGVDEGGSVGVEEGVFVGIGVGVEVGEGEGVCVGVDEGITVGEGEGVNIDVPVEVSLARAGRLVAVITITTGVGVFPDCNVQAFKTKVRANRITISFFIIPNSCIIF